MSQSREAKRSQPLQKALIAALEVLKPNNATDAPVDQTVILEPLRLACETKAPVLQTTALDCISKLVSHSFFHTSSTDSPELGDTLTQIITATYTETTPDSVALQIVKSLLALVLSPTVPVHHSSLLKAVRTVYNIFLLSSDSINQMVAQGGLTQMVHHVFGRVNITPSFNASGSGGKEKGRKDSSASSSVPMTPVLSSATGASEPGTPTRLGIASGLMLETNEITSEATVGNGMQNEAVEPTELPTPTSEAPFTPGTPGGQDLPKITLSTFSLPNPNDAHPEEIDQDGEGGTTNSDGQPMSEQEMFVKDAFLVFRALCKLTMKPLMSEA
jgi:brefeldin A-inhibited guanine nucleotide-exchange protein